MSQHVVRLPDVGEGVAEAELVHWLVAVGEVVTPESALAEVLTDKATVEIACPVSGTVIALHGRPGDVLAVGGDLVVIELDATAGPATTTISPVPPTPAPAPAPAPAPTPTTPRTVREPDPTSREHERSRPRAAPAVRRDARERGIDLGAVHGTGPGGRILRRDLDHEPTTAPVAAPRDVPDDHPVTGIRRRIAERLTTTWQAPHITYVEEVDVTEVEHLREALNARPGSGDRVTPLAFIARAVVLACADHPQMNAHVAPDASRVTRHTAVHLGIATQTDSGLLVPVVHHAERLSLRELAGEIRRLADAARDGSAPRTSLTGSTITISSLGALGGLMTTPLLNHPEVAIVGVNKIATRPVWGDHGVVPREMMNLSASFDHRVVDGWDAAVFVQRIRELLELPALLAAGGAL